MKVHTESQPMRKWLPIQDEAKGPWDGALCQGSSTFGERLH
jgi:hypothetical protein